MSNYNLATALFKMAESDPNGLAIAIPSKPGKSIPDNHPIPYHKISWKDLANQTNQIAKGLIEYGFHKGDRVVLMVPPSIDFFSISFALMQSGIIPVLIDPGIGIKNLKKCISDVRPVGFIGITKAHIARLIFSLGKNYIKKTITIGPRLFWGGTSLNKIKNFNKSNVNPVCNNVLPNEISGIFFTSGSTGISKGAIYTHANMIHQVEIIRKTFNNLPGEIDMPTFPPFALFNPTYGISTIIPDMDPTIPAQIDAKKTIRIIKQFNVTSMFGSPSLIDRLGRYGEINNIKLPSLKRVFSAGAPVPAKTLRCFTKMLNSSTQVFTPYGATEAMPVTYIGSHQLIDEQIQSITNSGGGICIGNPLDTLEVKIIQISDDPIPSWNPYFELPNEEIGEIIVKGKNVSSLYFNRDKANKLTKIQAGNSFWHRMGDLGYKDKEGKIWFCGRKSHRVKLADKELFTIQCESIFNTHPQVYRTALVGVNNKAVLCVELESSTKNPKRELIKKDLLNIAQNNKLTSDIRTILFHPSFPVDIRHNAKIFREKLTKWAAKKII